MERVLRKLPLCEVVNASVTEDGFVSPSGISFRRVDVWGVVVRKFVGDKSTLLVVDDFTATLPVVLLGDLRDVEVDEGDVVRVMGSVREREGEKRLLADYIKKIGTEEELVQRLRNVLTLLRLGRTYAEEEVEVVDVL